MCVEGSDSAYSTNSSASTPRTIRLSEWRRKKPTLRFDTSSQLALGAQPVVDVGAVGCAAFEEQLVGAARDLFSRYARGRTIEWRIDWRVAAAASGARS